MKKFIFVAVFAVALFFGFAFNSQKINALKDLAVSGDGSVLNSVIYSKNVDGVPKINILNPPFIDKKSEGFSNLYVQYTGSLTLTYQTGVIGNLVNNTYVSDYVSTPSFMRFSFSGDNSCGLGLCSIDNPAVYTVNIDNQTFVYNQFMGLAPSFVGSPNNSISDNEFTFIFTNNILTSVFDFSTISFGIFYNGVFYSPEQFGSLMYENGYNDGVADGYADGYAVGFADGYNDGVADGVADGYADGVVDGAADGYADGYGFGAADGYADGYEKGSNTNFNGVAILTAGISSFFSVILGLEIFPDFYLGYIIGFVAILGLVGFFLKLGGKK